MQLAKPDSTKRLTGFIIVVVLLLLLFVQLGFWQLGRASDKTEMLTLQTSTAELSPVPLSQLIEQSEAPGEIKPSEFRYRNVTAGGNFVSGSVLYLDRQVRKSRPGYGVFALLDLGEEHVLVNLGWVAAGALRQDLPNIVLPQTRVELSGRLNYLPPAPPIWNERYSVNDGALWQFLPVAELETYFDKTLVPLVLELNEGTLPETLAKQLTAVAWALPDNDWVARHKGYAFQWFAMAFALLCVSFYFIFRPTK